MQLVEHALSAGRAFVVGGGILASTFLLTAAMQPTAEVAPAPVQTCGAAAAGHVSGPLAPIELLPLDPPVGPRATAPPPVVQSARLPPGRAARRARFALSSDGSRRLDGAGAISGGGDATPRPEGFTRLTRAGALLARGDAAYRAGHFWSALRRYLQAAQQDPSLADAHFGVALARFELMDDRGSRRALRRALHRRPDHPLAHLLLGYLDQLEGRPGDARAHYQQYLLADPAGSFSSEVRTLLGQL